MPIRVEGIEVSLDQLKIDLDDTTSRETRALAFLALGDLQVQTPVLTGRAANSWELTRLFPETPFEQLLLQNRAPYINRLNEGSSAQAPVNFIQNTLLQYFDSVVILPSEVDE